jgi:predicted anti-sigma-YlaC factor YlaD
VNCQDLLDQLSEYLDRETREELCREIEEHLDKCHDCRVVVDQTRRTILLYQADQPMDLPGLMAASTRLQTLLAKEYGEPKDRPVD